MDEAKLNSLDREAREIERDDETSCRVLMISSRIVGVGSRMAC